MSDTKQIKESNKHDTYEATAKRMQILNVRTSKSDDNDMWIGIRDWLKELGDGDAKSGIYKLAEKIMKKFYKDKLFGEVDTRETTASVDLDRVAQVAAMLPSQSFYSQLVRLLRDNNGKLALMDYTSSPDFYPILDSIPASEFDCIFIGNRTDQNDAVKATLDCTLFLASGVITVITQWCAYKDIRAQEIVDSLLLPIRDRGLLDRTFVKFTDDDIESLPSDTDEAASVLFALSGYPQSSYEFS